MRYILALLLTINTAFASIESYSCKDIDARQHGLKIYSQVELSFDYVVEEGHIFLEDVVGSIKVSYENNLESDQLYYGVFQFHEIFQNLEYAPKKYIGYVQFPNFDVYESNNFDGGGIWGEFIVENNLGAQTLNAHYIFQAGDHMGGTIDLICHRK